MQSVSVTSDNPTNWSRNIAAQDFVLLSFSLVAFDLSTEEVPLEPLWGEIPASLKFATVHEMFMNEILHQWRISRISQFSWAEMICNGRQTHPIQVLRAGVRKSIASFNLSRRGRGVLDAEVRLKAEITDRR